jgi:hypothetical protein
MKWLLWEHKDDTVITTEITFRFGDDRNLCFFCSENKHSNILPESRIADSVLPEHAVNFVRDGVLGPFHFVEESDDGLQVNH